MSNKNKSKLIKRLITGALCLTLVFSINGFASVVSDNDGSAFITKAEFDSLKNNFQSQIDQYNQSIDSKIDGAIAAYLAGINITTMEDWGNWYNSCTIQGSTYNDTSYGPLKWYSATATDKNKDERNKYEVEAHFFQNGVKGGGIASSETVFHIYGMYRWNADYKNRRIITNNDGKMNKFAEFQPKVQTIISFPSHNEVGSVPGALGNSGWNMSAQQFGSSTAIGYVGQITRPSCVIGPLALYWGSFNYQPTSINFYTEKITDTSASFTIGPRVNETIKVLPETTTTKTTAYTTFNVVNLKNQGTETSDTFVLKNQTMCGNSGTIIDPRATGGVMTQKFIEYMYGCVSIIENELEVANWEASTGETFKLKHGLPLFKAPKNATKVLVRFDIEKPGFVYIYKKNERDTWGGNIDTWDDITKLKNAGNNVITLTDVTENDIFYFVYLPQSTSMKGGIKFIQLDAEIDS